MRYGLLGVLWTGSSAERPGIQRGYRLSTAVVRLLFGMQASTRATFRRSDIPCGRPLLCSTHLRSTKVQRGPRALLHHVSYSGFSRGDCSRLTNPSLERQSATGILPPSLFAVGSAKQASKTRITENVKVPWHAFVGSHFEGIVRYTSDVSFEAARSCRTTPDTISVSHERHRSSVYLARLCLQSHRCPIPHTCGIAPRATQ
jgi:hypothetical protein